MRRRANAREGSGDRDTVASRYSFIPFLIQKTKNQGSREEARGKTSPS